MSDHHHTANRKEDGRLITGAGRYASDWNLPGQLHAHFLRADRAHARIVSIDASGAERMPGVRLVLTGRHAVEAGYTRVKNLVAFPGRDGKPIAVPERPVLAADRVRHVGDALALVIADTPLAAQDAAEAIAVVYEDLPAVVDPAAALAGGAPLLHDDIPGNQCFDWEAGEEAAVEAAMAAAAHVTRLRLRTTRVLPNPMEPRACLVSHTGADDSYDLYCCGQGKNTLRMQIAFTTGVAEERIRLHMHDVGGSFGQRSPFYPEHGALMLAARRLGRPIKWVSSRSEGMVSDTHGRGFDIDAALALDADGRFLAARFDFLLDMGAYLSFAGPGSHTRNPAVCMTGVYRIPALYGRFRLALTNTVPIGPYRGAGRPDIAYAVERLVNKAAQELGKDPLALRRLNFIPPEAFPYKSPTGGSYEACDFAAVLDKALQVADWDGYPQRAEASRRAGKLRGRGISTVIENTGAGLFPKDQVELVFDAAGNITLYSLAQSSGQGHETVFTQIVADALGIDSARVGLVQSPVDRELVGNHTGGSRSLAGQGSVCRLAALKAIDQGRAVAAVELNVEPSQVDYAHGVFTARESGKSVSFEELAARDAAHLQVMAEASVGSTYPNGCHLCEVEIDPDTGAAAIVAYTAVDDSGNVLNHAIVEGQVHGAVLMGAGQVFGEEGVYDPESGQFLTGSFMDYFMPRAGMIRHMNVDDVPLPTKANVLGAKGVGEAGCGGSLPALTNAVLDALGPLGIHHLDMPLTPNRLWQAIRAARHTS